MGNSGSGQRDVGGYAGGIRCAVSANRSWNNPTQLLLRALLLQCARIRSVHPTLPGVIASGRDSEEVSKLFPNTPSIAFIRKPRQH